MKKSAVGKRNRCKIMLKWKLESKQVTNLVIIHIVDEQILSKEERDNSL